MSYVDYGGYCFGVYGFVIMETITFKRPVNLYGKIVFLDGISGTGKSLLINFLSSLKNGEAVKYEHIYEYLCILHHYHKIKADAAVHLMKLLADIHFYNQGIGRNANLRWGDQSCILHSCYPLDYVKQLFMNNGQNKNSCFLGVMTHQILPVVDLAFQSFKNNLRVIEMVRHPVYMFDHWLSYIHRYGVDKYEFTLWTKNDDGFIVPWFANSYGGSDYILDSLYNRVVYSLDFLFKQSIKTFNHLKKNYQQHVLFIPFESFVLNPFVYVQQICDLLGTGVTWKSRRMLKKENVPRKRVVDVPDNSLWRRYGNKSTNRFLSDSAVFKIKKAGIEKYLDDDSRGVFRGLCSWYEDEYMKDLN